MKAIGGAIIFGVVGLVALIVLSGALYTVPMTEQVIITQFGETVGEPITNAGLHVKLPFVQDVNRIEKRVLPWDGEPSEMPTKDKTYIVADAFGRWRISNPTQFFVRLRDLRRAESRLDDILGSEIRNAIAKHQLIEIVRTTKGRSPMRDDLPENVSTNLAGWRAIEKGRSLVEAEIFENAAPKLIDFGIELLDVRFKRINYNQSVREQIYQRMISERQQIAERFRSEGEEEAAKILGDKEKDLQAIESEAYQRIQEVQGEADAKATEIYASAFNRSPEAVDFYEFLKTMETLERVLSKDSTLILTTDSDLFKYLKGPEPERSSK
ncbi:MAG: protease modulator HflC [Verrucomicrobiae bacterium]|jgi:membrane protease subunit HflC|nr:protease modulator HflC [Verrucomicrobiae bacterium]